MIEKTIAEIAAKIRAEAIDEDRKNELLRLLAELKAQVAARNEQKLQPLRNSVEELRASVEGFEKSHPKIVEAVNSISHALSNFGI